MVRQFWLFGGRGKMRKAEEADLGIWMVYRIIEPVFLVRQF